MSAPPKDHTSHAETSFGHLLQELQIIWDEVGEGYEERDKMLLQLEQECLDVYRRKVDEVNKSRAMLRKSIADAEGEIAAIFSVLGDPPVHLRQGDWNRNPSSLREELMRVIPKLEEMHRRKSVRVDQFLDVLGQLRKISVEMGSNEYNSSMTLDESDLSIKKLEGLQKYIGILQKEKMDRLSMVCCHLEHLTSLCLVLGMDFNFTVGEIHPSLDTDYQGPKDITVSTTERLQLAVQLLREVKLQRMQKLQDLASTLLELWHLMDTPSEEQQPFQKITCNIAASEHEITDPGMLSEDVINNVENEVLRLEAHKTSKIKELVIRKKTDLDEICRRSHLIPSLESAVGFSVDATMSGSFDTTSSVLENIEVQIAKAKEEAFSRKEILEKVEKWISACEEEAWLDEYNRDDNRYAAGKGAHLMLKKAEKARVVVSKIPSMVEALVAKTTTWEKEKGVKFTYDRVLLLSMLEEYTTLRQEKEQERRRQRDQKRVQGQMIAEQEAIFRSKQSSPLKALKRLPSNNRLSLASSTMVQSPKQDQLTQSSRTSRLTRKTVEGHVASDGRRGTDSGSVSSKRLPFISSNAYEVVGEQIRNLTENMTHNKNLPMHVQIGHAPAPASDSVSESSGEDDDHREIDYSFEERRAGFVS